MANLRMRFYHVAVPGVNPTPVAVTAPSNALIGVTTADIVNGKIVLRPSNIPGMITFDPAIAASGFESAVEETADGRFLASVLDIQLNRFQMLVPAPPKKASGLTDSLAFEFLINPQQVTPSFKKNNTPTLTRGGYEVQHWGNALTSLRVEAVTGNLSVDRRGARSFPLDSGTPITQSTAYQYLKDLRKLYYDDHAGRGSDQRALLGLQYYDMFCIGYFEDFSGPVASAEKPNLMSFSFTFTVQQIIITD